MIWVYVIWSQSAERFYVGMTKDVVRRLGQHNAGHNVSTKNHRPFVLVFSESYADRTEARIREKYLKSAAGRRFIQRVLKGMAIISK